MSGTSVDIPLSAADHVPSEAPTALFRFVAAGTGPIVRRVFRLSTSGLDHLPRGGFVLCSNHLSGFDACALSVPLYPRQPRYMAKSELFVAVLRPLLRACGLFPVRRGVADEGAIETAVRHVKAGRVVLIFPEGARRRNRRLRPRRGAARVALTARVPLVPAAVHGTERPRLGRPWRVAFGPPVPLDDLYDLPPAKAVREATRRLWERVTELEESIRA